MTTPWQNVTDPLFHHAAARPDVPAIIDGGTILTYHEFATLVAKATVDLRIRGIGRGHRVGVSLTNGADHLILTFALLRIGAVLVELPAWGKIEPAHTALVRKMEIGTVFAEADADEVPRVTTFRLGIGWRGSLAALDGDYSAPNDSDELYYITLTSGSTGIPKGVITTHQQRLLRSRGESPVLDSKRPGNFLLAAGISYSGFFSWMMNQIFAGGPVIILPTYAKAIEFAREIASWQDAVAFVTPNMCRLLVKLSQGRGPLLPNVRTLISGGLPLLPEEKRAVIERITPNFHEVYGNAGCGVISMLHPSEIPEHSASVGRPMAEIEVEVVDAIGNRPPPGAAGHFRCRGPSLSKGFHGEETGMIRGEGFRDGWYYPGEIAALDEAGYIHIKGRVSDIITRRGIEVFPSEIEAVLLAHPVVEEAAVVGRPATDIGEAVIAFVKLRGPLDHHVLAAYCADRLPPEKRPNGLFFAKELPRTGTGKIDRDRLKTIPIGKDARLEAS